MFFNSILIFFKVYSHIVTLEIIFYSHLFFEEIDERMTKYIFYFILI